MNIELIGIHCVVQIQKYKTADFQWYKSVNFKILITKKDTLHLPIYWKKVCVTPTEANEIYLQTFMALFCSSH